MLKLHGYLDQKLLSALFLKIIFTIAYLSSNSEYFSDTFLVFHPIPNNFQFQLLQAH